MCNYCEKKGHVKDECYKFHGRPQEVHRGYGEQWKGQVNLSRSKELSQSKEELGSQESSSTMGLDKQDIEKLKAFLKTLGTSSTNPGVCSFAQSCMSIASCGYNASSYNQPSSWIMDSGATDHITFSSSSLSNYTSCSSSRKIITTVGSSITMAGIGDNYLSSSP